MKCRCTLWNVFCITFYVNIWLSVKCINIIALPQYLIDLYNVCAGKGGIVAMVVTYSDRQVRMFCYQSFSEVQVSSTGVPCHGQIVQVEKWQLAGQVSLLVTDLPSWHLSVVCF